MAETKKKTAAAPAATDAEATREAKRKALEADAKKGKTVETNEDAEKLFSGK